MYIFLKSTSKKHDCGDVIVMGDKITCIFARKEKGVYFLTVGTVDSAFNEAHDSEEKVYKRMKEILEELTGEDLEGMEYTIQDKDKQSKEEAGDNELKRMLIKKILS